MLTSDRAYRNSGEYTLIVFDLRVPGTAERLRRELSAWKGSATVEVIDGDRRALIVRPGLARGITSRGLPNEDTTR